MALFKDILYCPVCRTYLAERYKDEIISSHCTECKAIFTWGYKQKVPTVKLDAHKDNSCKCGYCNR